MPKNAFLIVCSGLPISRQRQIANELASQIDLSRWVEDPKPVSIDLPWLTPNTPVSTFHNTFDDSEAQSDLSVAYNLPTPRSFEECVLLDLALSLVNRKLYAVIREKRNLAYSSDARLETVENTNHGLDEGYYGVEIVTPLAGKNAIKALEGIDEVEQTVGKDSDRATATLHTMVRSVKDEIQATPTDVADNIASSDQVYFKHRYNPAEKLEFIKSLDTREVCQAAEALLRDRRVVMIAGPNPRELDKVAKFALRNK